MECKLKELYTTATCVSLTLSHTEVGILWNNSHPIYRCETSCSDEYFAMQEDEVTLIFCNNSALAIMYVFMLKRSNSILYTARILHSINYGHHVAPI